MKQKSIQKMEDTNSDSEDSEGCIQNGVNKPFIPLLINMWSSYVLAHYKESHGPLGSEDGALRAAGPNEPYELLDSRTPSEAPFSR